MGLLGPAVSRAIYDNSNILFEFVTSFLNEDLGLY